MSQKVCSLPMHFESVEILIFETDFVKNLRELQPCVSGVNESTLVAFDKPQWVDYFDVELLILKSGCDKTDRRKKLLKVCVLLQGKQNYF